MDNPSPYPVNVTAEYPERSSRLLALCGLIYFIKLILLIPHSIVLFVLGIVAFFTTIVGYLAILVLGWNPRGLFDFHVGLLRWSVRVNAWLFSIVDEYPPFRLRE